MEDLQIISNLEGTAIVTHRNIKYFWRICSIYLVINIITSFIKIRLTDFQFFSIYDDYHKLEIFNNKNTIILLLYQFITIFWFWIDSIFSWYDCIVC